MKTITMHYIKTKDTPDRKAFYKVFAEAVLKSGASQQCSCNGF